MRPASSDANAGDVSGDEFAISASGGAITVTGKSPWHLNKKYPWAIGSVKGDAITFTGCKTEGDNVACDSAKATGQSGTVKVKMGVCNGATCKSITKDVTL